MKICAVIIVATVGGMGERISFKSNGGSAMGTWQTEADPESL